MRSSCGSAFRQIHVPLSGVGAPTSGVAPAACLGGGALPERALEHSRRTRNACGSREYLLRPSVPTPAFDSTNPRAARAFCPLRALAWASSHSRQHFCTLDQPTPTYSRLETGKICCVDSKPRLGGTAVQRRQRPLSFCLCPLFSHTTNQAFPFASGSPCRRAISLTTGSRSPSTTRVTSWGWPRGPASKRR